MPRLHFFQTSPLNRIFILHPFATDRLPTKHATIVIFHKG